VDRTQKKPNTRAKAAAIAPAAANASGNGTPWVFIRIAQV
jgi:hypothetical protein